MQTINEKIEAARKELTQAQNRLKTLTNRKRDEEHRERTHRLIERGAIMESLVEGLEKVSNEQVRDLLTVALSIGEVKHFLRSLGLP